MINSDKTKVKNSKRFIEAYNKIDHSLRSQYNFKRGQSFGDMIRRCTALNSIVRKFEDVLIDYSRLRNAIIHNDNDQFVIAEPHDDVVEKIESIAELICTPPLVINTVCSKEIMMVNADETLDKVLKKMYESGYSNLPVLKGDNIVGMANGQKLADRIGNECFKNKSIDDFLKSTTILDIIKQEEPSSIYYMIEPATITIDQALNLFYSNRKLIAILISKTGKLNEPALGIVTVADIMDLNSIMDNYK